MSSQPPPTGALFEWIVRGTAADGLPRLIEGTVLPQAAEARSGPPSSCAGSGRARGDQAGKRLLIALDVSGSMVGGQVAGVPGLTPRNASAALALVTTATESHYETVGFFAGPGGFRKRGGGRFAARTDGLTPPSISPHQRLDDAVKTVSGLPFGGTDCGLPMLYAQALQREIDTFVIYTDSETWAGDIHPVQALRGYRHVSGIDARLVVVGMVSNGFSIADPADPVMLDSSVSTPRRRS